MENSWRFNSKCCMMNKKEFNGLKNIYEKEQWEEQKNLEQE